MSNDDYYYGPQYLYEEDPYNHRVKFTKNWKYALHTFDIPEEIRADMDEYGCFIHFISKEQVIEMLGNDIYRHFFRRKGCEGIAGRVLVFLLRTGLIPPYVDFVDFGTSATSQPGAQRSKANCFWIKVRLSETEKTLEDN